jgi:hypothetical protein
MPDDSSSPSPVPSGCRLLTIASLGLWVFEVTRFAVDGGPRSSPGYNRRRKFALCPKCGHKVRVGADGWGYCRKCREEFNFKLK